MFREIICGEIKKITSKNCEKIVWNDKFGVYAINLDSREKAGKIASSKKIKKYFMTEIVEKNERIFLNFHLNEKAVGRGLKFALRGKFDFAPRKNKAQVEFISANPTGELHIGHGRDAFYGDALANILDFAGYKVEREYYINDAKESRQIKELGKTVLGKGKTYFTKDLGIKIKDLRIETEDEGKAGYLMAQKIQEDNKKFITQDLKIKFDNWLSEEKDLKQKNYFEKGRKAIDEFVYKKDGAVWFESSKFGDTEDNVVIRSDGTPTYFLGDVAYFARKFTQKYDKLIHIWGADHQGHVKRVYAAKKALGWKGELEILVGQLVALKEGGKRKRLSKRKGDVVWLKDLIKDVGLDAARWFFLEKRLTTHMEFDMDLAKEQSKKNPVYYAQYAGARMSSILKKAKASKKNFNFSSSSFIYKLLKDPTASPKEEKSNFFSAQKALVLKLIQFPEIIEDVSKDYQVHHLTTYIYELAKTFTDFYENVRVLGAETEELKEARLGLIFITKQILGKGLSLMGISVPTNM